MRILPVLAAVVALSTVATTPRAESAPRDCLELIRMLYGELNEVSENRPAPGRACHLKYRVSLTVQDSLPTLPRETSVELWVASDQMQLITDEVQFYQDRDGSFTVLPGERLILWGDSYPDQVLAERRRKSFLLLKNVFDSLAVEDCREVKWQSRRATRVTTVPRDRNFAASGMKELVFYAGGEPEALLGLEITYDPPAKGVRAAKAVFEIIEADVEAPKDDASLVSPILDGDGALRPEYSAYRLEDIRKRTAAKGRR